MIGNQEIDLEKSQEFDLESGSFVSASSCVCLRVGAGEDTYLRGGAAVLAGGWGAKVRSSQETDWWSRSLLDLTKSFTWATYADHPSQVLRKPNEPRYKPLNVLQAANCDYFERKNSRNQCK